ncbi:hypothetical protein JCM14036_16520 [Desulfotomaculum defluvii]
MVIQRQEKDSIRNVLFSQNPITAYKNSKLKNCTYALFDANNTAFENYFEEKTFGIYRIIGLSNYKKMIVLNDCVLEDLKNNNENSQIKLAHCINFDSNIASLINKLINSKKPAIDNEFYKFLLYIKENAIQTTILPYMMESKYNNKISDTIRVYQTILAFFMFDRLTKEQLNEQNFSKPSSEDYILADKAWHEFKINSDSEIFDRYLVIYCLLCKTCLIKLFNKKSYTNKVSMLVEFINNELYCYLEYEFVLCCLFLKNDQSVEHFFRFVQPNSSDLIGDLKNMTWDLMHLRNIGTEMAIRNSLTNYENIFYAHSFGSADQGLLNILKLNPIKRVAFYKGEAYIRFQNTIEDVCEKEEFINNLLLNSHQREQCCLSISNRHLPNLAAKLENELLGLLH